MNTCEHGLSRSSLRVRTLRVELGRKNDEYNNNNDSSNNNSNDDNNDNNNNNENACFSSSDCGVALSFDPINAARKNRIASRSKC